MIMIATANTTGVRISPSGHAMLQRFGAGSMSKSMSCRVGLLEEGHLQTNDEVCGASCEFSHVTAAPEVSFVSLNGHASSQGRTLCLISLQLCKYALVRLLPAPAPAQYLCQRTMITARCTIMLHKDSALQMEGAV